MRSQSPSGSTTGCDSGTVLFLPCTRPAPARATRRPAASGASAPSWTSASDGAESSAKPPPPRTTSTPEVWKAGPSTWARQAASTGFRGWPAERARGAVDAQRAARGVDDGLPARAPAQVGAQGRLDVAPRRWPPRRRAFERGQPQHDARRAEAALAGPVFDECGCPAVTQFRRSSLEGGDLASRDAADGRDAGDAGRAVDPHGAASALALGAAAVLHGAAAELLAQHVQEADPILHRDGFSVEDERDGPARARQRPKVAPRCCRLRSGGGVPMLS